MRPHASGAARRTADGARAAADHVERTTITQRTCPARHVQRVSRLQHHIQHALAQLVIRKVTAAVPAARGWRGAAQAWAGGSQRRGVRPHRQRALTLTLACSTPARRAILTAPVVARTGTCSCRWQSNKGPVEKLHAAHACVTTPRAARWRQWRQVHPPTVAARARGLWGRRGATASGPPAAAQKHQCRPCRGQEVAECRHHAPKLGPTGARRHALDCSQGKFAASEVPPRAGKAQQSGPRAVVQARDRGRSAAGPASRP